MTRPYFVLAMRDGSPGCPWGVAFGDYDQATVEDERQDYLDNGSPASALRILRVGDGGRQSDIDAAIAKLNAAGSASKPKRRRLTKNQREIMGAQANCADRRAEHFDSRGDAKRAAKARQDAAALRDALASGGR